jgi:hypothetical protein
MPHLATYIGMVHRAEQTLAESLLTVGDGHKEEADVFHTCQTLAKMSQEHEQQLAPIVARYGEERAGDDVEEPDRLHADGVAEVREGSIGLLRDLQDLYLLATLVQTCWTVIYQAAQGVRDRDLMAVAEHSNSEISRVLTWINTRMKEAAPQALLMTP